MLVYNHRTMSFNIPKLGVPQPVTGSHPVVACEHDGEHRHTGDDPRSRPHIETFGATSRIVPNGDVIEGSSRVRVRVQRPDKRVEEAQRRPPLGDAGVVQQGHDPRERWRRTRCAVDKACLAVHDDREVDAFSCYVGDSLRLT